MELEDILRWVFPVVIGVAVIVMMQRMMGRVGKAGVERLARFGLAPQAGTGWALMDRTDAFLDAAILLVEQMQVARQTG
jgi:hypothetical protein